MRQKLPDLYRGMFRRPEKPNNSKSVPHDTLKDIRACDSPLAPIRYATRFRVQGHHNQSAPQMQDEFYFFS